MNIKLSTGHRIIGYFLLFSTLILLIAGLSLVVPGSFSEKIWFFKKPEFRQMLSHRILIGAGFWLLAVIMAFAAMGWFKKRYWGWILTLCIFGINGVSDGMRLIMGSYIEGAIGVCITAAIIFYLTRPSMEKLFSGATD